jgi:hypothetical protein
VTKPRRLFNETRISSRLVDRFITKGVQRIRRRRRELRAELRDNRRLLRFGFVEAAYRWVLYGRNDDIREALAERRPRPRVSAVCAAVQSNMRLWAGYHRRGFVTA